MLIRKANAVWEGTLKEGNGKMQLGSGAWEGPYSFGSRFEEGAGTNPEELIGAAHAGCFSMALAGILGQAGHPPKVIRTTAEVALEAMRGGYRIKSIKLVTTAMVPGIDKAGFLECAENAKKNCPVSKALGGGVEIELEAALLENSAEY